MLSILDFIKQLLTDENLAGQYAADPGGTLAIQEVDLSGVTGAEMRDLVAEACSTLDLPADRLAAVQAYTSGAVPATSSAGAPAASGQSGVAPPPTSPPPMQPPVEQVMQHLNYVTYVSYPHNEYITQEITNIDNSTNVDVDVEGDNYGDIDLELDVENANATGDGAVAGAGSGDVNAATGDGSQVIDGDNYGTANTGDGAVVGNAISDSAVNTGTNSGVMAGGSVEDTVVGDGNQVANIGSGGEGSNVNFGSGDITDFGDAEIEGSSVAIGGDATNVSDNTVEEGSALAVGGDASGSFSDDNSTMIDETTTITEVEAHESVVSTEQGDGSLDQQADLDIED
jgi:hypothetical protein